MKAARTLFTAVCLLAMVGCYAASIDTGRSPSAKVIRRPWASAWIYGLVPPKTVETATECPNGVAKVETQLSFLNQLVGALTFGIYTPMQIVVTCAEAQHSALAHDSELLLAKNAPAEEVRQTFERAADLAIKTHQPVFVRMDR
jgi:Bor protein